VACFDRSALAEVYDHFSPGIYRYAMRLLGEVDMAEECVAETFHRFLVGVQNGNVPDQYLQAYLYRIAHNWITDLYRRHPPDPLSLDTDLVTESLGEPVIEVSERLEVDRVRSALALLTPDQRQVVVLKYLEDFSHEEIAHTLQKPLGAVKALQHRALASLRRLLSHEEEELL
jgi:RNA polymerase sigma-70 factor (ECF subfamily)